MVIKKDTSSFHSVQSDNGLLVNWYNPCSLISVAPPLCCKMGPVKWHPPDTGKFELLCARDADFSLIVPHQSNDPEKRGRGQGGQSNWYLKNKKKSYKLFKDSRKDALY